MKGLFCNKTSKQMDVVADEIVETSICTATEE